MLPTIQQALRRIIRNQPDTASWAARTFQNSSKKIALRRKKLHDLIKEESKIGATLFGELRPKHGREFFCLDEKTWVWQDTWVDEESGKKMKQTVRYEVRDNGILKSVNGGDYVWVNEEEASNLAHAAVLYHQYVVENIYNKKKHDVSKGTMLDEDSPHMQMEHLM